MSGEQPVQRSGGLEKGGDSKGKAAYRAEQLATGSVAGPGVRTASRGCEQGCL